MAKETLLFLDDYRSPYENNGAWLIFSPLKSQEFEVHWVKNYNQFVEWISKNGLPTGICFDHDLSDVQSAYAVTKKEVPGHEKTGYDCAVWLVEYCYIRDLPLPLYNVQSANPVGKKRIIAALENYKKNH